MVIKSSTTVKPLTFLENPRETEQNVPSVGKRQDLETRVLPKRCSDFEDVR